MKTLARARWGVWSTPEHVHLSMSKPKITAGGRSGSSDGLRGGAGAALNFQDLVAQVLPVTIPAPAMVEDERRLTGVGIFEPGEQVSGLNRLRALFALLYFRHGFLASRGA